MHSIPILKNMICRQLMRMCIRAQRINTKKVNYLFNIYIECYRKINLKFI